MRLDQELVHRKLCESRQEAQECIESGYVLVDGVPVTKRTRLVTSESHIVVTKKRKFVSRGGDKLEGAILHVFPEASPAVFSTKIALDIGSSTGGFTDCLLRYGASHVYAVDVGTSQLHSSLRTNPNITIAENTDIRNFTTADLVDIIVADVSFISLDKILDTILSFGHTGTLFFLLIKPQFEVGFGNTKKGIVKDMTLVENVLNNYKKKLSKLSYEDIDIFPCTIQGGDGNQEYFIYFKK